MKKFITALAMLGIAFSLGAQAPSQKGNHQQMKERLQAEHIAFLTEKLELTPEEAQVFWPVYNKAKAEQKEGNKVIGEAKKATKLSAKPRRPSSLPSRKARATRKLPRLSTSM